MLDLDGLLRFGQDCARCNNDTKGKNKMEWLENKLDKEVTKVNLTLVPKNHYREYGSQDYLLNLAAAT